MKLNQCPAGTYCSRDDPVNVANPKVGLAVHPNKDDHGCAIHHYCPIGSTIQIPISPGILFKTTGAGSLLDTIQLPAGWYDKTFNTGAIDAGV